MTLDEATHGGNPRYTTLHTGALLDYYALDTVDVVDFPRHLDQTRLAMVNIVF